MVFFFWGKARERGSLSITVYCILDYACGRRRKSVLVNRARPGGFWRHRELADMYVSLPILSDWCENIWGIGVAFNFDG